MIERTPEQLFALWRRSGDVRALGEAFDRTAPELLQLARRLCRNRADAEDLVQATWLAAIESGARFQSGRVLAAWLVGIMVRQAGLARRREGRIVASPELEVAHDDDPAAPLEARELDEALAASLARLPQSEREVLASRLYDDKSAAEIARELGKQRQAIHMRASRGLARLRRMLAPGFGVGLVALLDRRALARVRERVVQSAGAPGGAAAATSLTTGGILLVNKVVLTCLVAAAVGALLWKIGVLDSSGDDAARAEVARNEALALRTPLPSAVAASDGGRVAVIPQASERPASGPDSKPPRWLVRGRLRRIEQSEQRPASVTIRASGLIEKPPEPVVATIDPHDEFEVDISSMFAGASERTPRDFYCWVDHPGYLPTGDMIHAENGEVAASDDGRPTTTYHWDPSLTQAAAIRVRILVPAGSPDTDCSAVAFSVASDRLTSDEVARAGGVSGSELLLRMSEGGEFAIEASSDSSSYASVRAKAEVGRETRLEDIQLTAGLSISGVVLADGTPQPGMQVHLMRLEDVVDPRLASTVRMPWWEGGRFLRPTGTAVSDSEGGFAISGLDEGSYGLICTGCVGGADLIGSIAGTQNSSPVVVRAPATGVAVPLTCAVIAFQFDGLDSALKSVPMRISNPGRGSGTCSANNPHGFRYGGTPGVKLTFEFNVPGYRSVSRESTLPGAGEVRLESVSFEKVSPSKLTIKLPAGLSDPILRAFVQIEVPDAPRERRAELTHRFSRDATFENGSFSIDDLPPGSYRVIVRPGVARLELGGYYVEDEFTANLAAGAELEHLVAVSSGGRARLTVTSATPTRTGTAFRLVAPDGRVLDPMIGRRTDHGTNFHGSTLIPGVWEIEPALPPGESRIVLTSDGKTLGEIPFTIYTGQVTDVAIDLDGH